MRFMVNWCSATPIAVRTFALIDRGDGGVEGGQRIRVDGREYFF